MTNESAILRAYALLSQGKFAEAEQMLKDTPGALNTPSGADLFARLRFEQGLADEARQIWERIHAAFPDFDPANKALAAFQSPPEQQDDQDDEDGNRRFPLVAFLFVLVGGALAVWGLLRKPETVVQVKESVLTNTVERIVNVPVTSYVTSVVERVSIVTNTIPVVRREVVTNTIERVVTVERVVTNETVKVVVKEPPAAKVEGAEALIASTKKTPTEPGTLAANSESSAGLIMPTPNRSRTPFASQETWFDRAILGLYKKLGLIPDTRPYFMIEGEK